jgi:hypothetical protein
VNSLEVSMTRFAVLAFAAALGFAGLAQAQSSPNRLDPYGQPYVGAQNWHEHAQPGDLTRQAPGMQPQHSMATEHRSQQQAMAPMEHSAHAFAFKDEYGFRYDAQGNRLDRHGHVMSPHNPSSTR